jgi:hypothetical protein
MVHVRSRDGFKWPGLIVSQAPGPELWDFSHVWRAGRLKGSRQRH